MRVGIFLRDASSTRILWLLCVPVVMSSLTWAERLPIKTYTTADGLARDQISRIVQDSHGFLWFCTVDGLSRFDGYKFTSYTTASGLPDSVVNDLLETRDGTYLVATPNGLCQFNPRGTPLFTVWRPAEPEANAINELLEDRSGAIWCGTSDGLYLLEYTDGQYSFQFVDLGLPRENCDSRLIESLMEDQSGALWVGTRGSGLCRYLRGRPTQRFTVAQGLPSNRITALLDDKAGSLWVGTACGLCRLAFDQDSPRPIVARVYSVRDGLTDNWITTLLQSRDGRLLVGSRGLSVRIATTESSHPQFRRYAATQGLTDISIQAMAEDRDGNLWLGTDNAGALKIARNGFHIWDRADGLGKGELFSIFEDQKGEVCVFLRDRQRHEYIAGYERQQFTRIRLNLLSRIGNIGWGWGQCALQGRGGEWWSPTGEGLYRFPPGASFSQLAQSRPAMVYTTISGLATDDVFRLFEDSGGNVWIGSISVSLNGLTRWERSEERLHTFSEADGLPTRNVLPTAFGEDHAGNVWVGFSLAGLGRYSAGRFTVYTTADGAPPGWIRAIYCDRLGRLWVSGGEGGVTRIDDPQAANPRFVPYTTAEGLSSNQVDCITEDQWGRLYFGTGRGLDRLDPATGYIKHYTEADGLIRGRVRYALRGRGGVLWFGNNNELSHFIPEPDRPQSPPPILIQGLHIAGVASPISELGESEIAPLQLSAGQNQVGIDFVGLEFAPGEVLRYQYKLEGADSDWSAPTEQRTVNYAHLAAGSYRFLVRAITAEGVISSQPAIASFTILPPLWQRWWFAALGVALLGLLIYCAHRYRLARLLELERVRIRIASDLHDDLASNLSLIAGLSEVLGQQARRTEPQMIDKLSLIASVARKSVDSMSDIVWAVNPNKDHLADLTQRMRRFASDAFTTRGIGIQFEAPNSTEDTKVGAEVRREVFLIFKEGINNILRHSCCTMAVVALQIDRGIILLKIGDNGRGFDVGRTECGQGLASMRKRAEKLGGELSVIASPGRGVTLTMKAPLK